MLCGFIDQFSEFNIFSIAAPMECNLFGFIEKEFTDHLRQIPATHRTLQQNICKNRPIIRSCRFR